MAAGTVTIAETIHSSVKKIKFTWTSGTGAEGGTASGTTTHAYSGKLDLLVTDPGSTAPTDNYDITLTDDDGVDVLSNAGADRDTANTERVLGTSLGSVAGSKLTFSVAAAGDAKEGVAYVYIR
jgi:hypothetical protein